MKNMKKIAKAIGTLGLVSCAVINSQFALAEDSGWIGGLSVGQATAKIDDDRIKARLLGAGLTTTSMSDVNSDTGFKIFAGYQFNKNFALEGGYFDLGKFGYTAITTPAGTMDGNIKLRGLNLDAVGMLPLAKKFSVFGRLGLNYAEAKDNFTSTGAVVMLTNPSSSKREANYKAGVGAQYDFNEYVGLRGEWERYRINDAVGSRGDINLYSIGVVVKLEKEKPAPAPKEAMPPPVIVAAPILIYVPVKEKTAKYCSVLDIQFEIKQDEVQSEDLEKLAVLGDYMKKYPDTTAVIEGHSDNVGTSEFNLKLSQQRADAMVNYLVDELKIDRLRLTSVGYGETRPIADNSTRAGQQANRRVGVVMACVTDVAGLKVKPARLTMAMEMEFDPYKSDVEPQYFDSLNEVANAMKANPAITATVEGHAGSYLGVDTHRLKVNPELAEEISMLRAQKVVDYLVDKQGISRSRLTVAAFGQSQRVAYGTTLEGQQENRRVNIIFNYKAK